MNVAFHHEDSLDIENAVAGFTEAEDEVDIERTTRTRSWERTGLQHRSARFDSEAGLLLHKE